MEVHLEVHFCVGSVAKVIFLKFLGGGSLGGSLWVEVHLEVHFCGGSVEKVIF